MNPANKVITTTMDNVNGDKEITYLLFDKYQFLNKHRTDQ